MDPRFQLSACRKPSGAGRSSLILHFVRLFLFQYHFCVPLLDPAFGHCRHHKFRHTLLFVSFYGITLSFYTAPLFRIYALYQGCMQYMFACAFLSIGFDFLLDTDRGSRKRPLHDIRQIAVYTLKCISRLFSITISCSMCQSNCNPSDQTGSHTRFRRLDLLRIIAPSVCIFIVQAKRLNNLY